MYDVACVGILVADVIAGKVSNIPQKGLLEHVDSVKIYSGGNAMTASINIKKLGAKTAIIGMVGKDIFGSFLKQCLADRGVDVKGLKESDDYQTSTSIVMVSEDGERSFLHCVGANGHFSVNDIDYDIIKDSKVVFVTGTYLLDTFDGAQTMEFLKKCKEMGKTTVLDCCWDSKDRWGSLLDMSMPYIDIFMPSIDEAKRIAKKDTLKEIADVFFEKGVKTVVIKNGKYGCYVRESFAGEGKEYPTYLSIKRVDTTGAGDSFCSGFLAAFARGKSIEECAKFANAVGTHCIMASGATTGIKSYEETLKFMEEHEVG
ncbi:MAG: carbohydrate kinase family protein [Bacillota bacterium]|nr:carbohydrate kinase family protein [Bacillota bacterium]